MSTRNRILLFGAAGLLLAIQPVFAQARHKAKPKARPIEYVLFENTGAGNYPFVLDSNGTAGMFGSQEDSGNLYLPKKITAKLFHDLDAAMPLSKLPVRRAMRSASLKTATYLSYKGQRSPDLSIPGNGKALALRDDIIAITKVFHVSNAPRSSQEAKLYNIETATIDNTGSTNTKGYSFTIESDGTAIGDNLSLQIISKVIADNFFQDLHNAQPLSALPLRHGMRSVSFGTSTYVTYKGQKSPDLTFGGEGSADALKADVAAITQALHVTNAPRRPLLMRPITP